MSAFAYVLLTQKKELECRVLSVPRSNLNFSIYQLNYLPGSIIFFSLVDNVWGAVCTSCLIFDDLSRRRRHHHRRLFLFSVV